MLSSKGFSPLFLYFLLGFGPTSLAAQGWDHDKLAAPSVIVDIGAPHAWTMEQAHYLLERNRAHDLGLAEKDPGQLDPNDTVGFRVQALATLLSATVQRDPSIGLKNNAALQAFNLQVQQYNQALTQRAAVFDQINSVTTTLKTAQQALSTLQSDPNADKTAVSNQQALVQGLNSQLSGLNSELTTLNTAVATAPSVSGVTSGLPSADETGTATALGDNPLFDNAVKGFSPGFGSSRLTAEQQLDNYINFQYEMVAKQLTLLRDQVGPDNRVIFVELPHSLYVTNKLHFLTPYIGGLWGAHLVQSWWTVGGALLARPLSDFAEQAGAHRPASYLETLELSKNFQSFRSSELNLLNYQIKDKENKLSASKLTLTQSIGKLVCKPKPASEKDPSGTASSACIEKDRLNAQLDELASEEQKLKDEQERANRARMFADNDNLESSHALSTFFTRRPTDSTASGISVSPNTFFNLTTPLPSSEGALTAEPLLSKDQVNFGVWAARWQYATFGLEHGLPGSASAPVFALDLIPRQSSMNVASSSMETHQYGFAGIFGWLSGLGARGKYEREQQSYNQFTQIENYASGFGKGDYTFGWTFAPNPGTKSIAAGLRTTYAILVVPKDTRVLRLNAVGCGFRRRNVPRNPFAPEAGFLATNLDDPSFPYLTDPVPYQTTMDKEDCGVLHAFDIEIPSGDDDFWISSADYEPVVAGQRAVVKIHGRFGDQTGVLINGTPLQRVPSISQPTLTPAGYAVPPNAGDSAVQGVFEIVNAKDDAGELSNDLVISFTMGPTYTGTPRIMIVSAARDQVVNDLPAPRSEAHEHKLMERPLFVQSPIITRVDANYDSADGPKVGVVIVGRGFTEDITSSVTINGTPLSPRKDKTQPPTNDTEFAVSKDGSVITATVTRKTFFPQWSVDYISTFNHNVADANYVRDDSVGPSVVLGAGASCTFAADAANQGKTPIHIILKGAEFTSQNVPKIQEDKDGVATAHFINNTEWDVDYSTTSGTQPVHVTITPAIKAYARTTVCTVMPPNPKPKAAPKVSAAKGKGPKKKI